MTTKESNSEHGVQRASGWRKRLDGLIPEHVDTKTVAIIGCGSVGSFIASELVRSGIRSFVLVDPDRVEAANLTRTVFNYVDIGEDKVEALKRHLLAVFPDTEVITHSKPIQDVGDALVPLLRDVDIVVSAVDQPRANGLIDRYCYALETPVVFVGLYKGAKGGEVVVTESGRSACFNCSTGGVRQMVEDVGLEKVDRSARDYGTNRLVAEVALGSDIHFVCAAAIKVTLSMLSGDDPESPLTRFMTSQLEEGCNFLMLGMEPNYFLFNSTHAKTHGQHAFQSIWAKTDKNPECEVCGLLENREPLN